MCILNPRGNVPPPLGELTFPPKLKGRPEGKKPRCAWEEAKVWGRGSRDERAAGGVNVAARGTSTTGNDHWERWERGNEHGWERSGQGNARHPETTIGNDGNAGTSTVGKVAAMGTPNSSTGVETVPRDGQMEVGIGPVPRIKGAWMLPRFRSTCLNRIRMDENPTRWYEKLCKWEVHSN